MIDEMLRNTVAGNSARPAIVFGDHTLTYGELDRQWAGVRAGLRRLGVGAGDTVFIVLPNCPAFVVTYFATAGLRATVQALDPDLKEAEFHRLARDSAPAVVVTDTVRAPLFGRIATALPKPPHLVVVDGPQDAAQGRDPAWTPFADVLGTGDAGGADEALDAGPAGDFADDWVITYSSGSTGEPRRVCRTQENQAAEAEHIVSTARITPEDVVLCPVPLFHALGQFCCMIVAMRSGATLVLVEPEDDRRSGTGAYPWYVGRVLDLVRERRVTVFPAVPYIFEALADVPGDVPADLSSVRLCLSGSNFLTPDVQERFQARYGVPIRQTYGSSEAGSVSWDCDPDTVVPGSVGRPLNGVTVEILAEDGTTLPPGAVGEIAVSSAAVTRGYADGGGAAAFRPGNHYLTGDLGRLGEDGRLYLTGRKRVLIDTGGHKVNPVEVEEVLERHPGVREAAVAGVPLRGGGDVLVAAVVAEGDVDAERLRDHCRSRLAAYKVPGEFVLVAEIPRSPLGKIRRARLAALVAAHVGETGPGPLDALRREADPAARAALVAAHLVGRSAAILGVRPEDVEEGAPLRAQGLDSLGALRLKMAVQDDLNRSVGLPELLGGATVETLAARLAAEEEAPAVAGLLPDGRTTGVFPLSHNQLSLWHADQLAPDSVAYNQSFAARLTSGCDTEALRRTFQALTDRHPVLRTTFGVRDGAPFQRVAAYSTADFATVEVPADWDAAATLSADALRPFDLGSDLPMRVRLYVPAAGEPALLVTVHHIVTDFWSLITMLKDIGTVYAAESAGEEVYRPAPRHSYADYGRWLAEQVAGPVGERDWAHWREVLRTPPPALDLPGDRPRPVVPVQRGATHFHTLGADCVIELQEFARRRETTVYSVMLAAFQVLLHAYTGERDLAVAAITTNRQRSEFHDVLGYFVNPVVCRTELREEEPFDALLDRVRGTLLSAMDHQMLPFEVIVERLGLKRDRSRAPLVEVAFGQNKAQDTEMLPVTRFLSGGGGHRLELGPLTLESVALEHRGMVYDFSGAVYEAGDSIAIAWEYNRELFLDTTVRVMAAQYETLLLTLLRRPAAPVGRTDVLPPADRRRLADASCGAPGREPAGGLPAVVAERAAASPQRTAVAHGPDRLSYADLHERAGRLADRLPAPAAAGDVSGERVALWLEPSADLAVAGLGVLTAGAVCDALEPTAAPEEVRDLLGTGAVRALVTTAERAALLGGTATPVVAVDATAGPGDPAPGRDRPTVTPDRPAAVLRTAGVTGVPRAVLADHRALLRHARWLGDTRPPSGDVLLHGGLGPGTALVRLLAVLAAGGTAVLRPDAASPAELAAVLSDGGTAGLVTLTPTELSGVLAELEREETRPGPVHLVLQGEVLPAHLVRRWRALAGETARVVHVYGGAGTGQVVSAGEVPGDLPEDSVVPAGLPVAGVDRFVLDASGRLCPVGAVGEICVSETAVARPADGGELPAERFAASPLDPDGAAPRLVRTGDLGRYLATGEVVVLGRARHLTRVRSYRVDPGPVEAVLTRLPSVGRAVVTGGGGQPLTAFVTSRDGSRGVPPEGGALRDALRRHLPEYLVPAEITVVSALPAAGDGKTGRAEPPRVEAAETRAADPGPAADDLTPTEAALAVIWQDILGVERVRPDDDYFDLDGDSITGMRIVSRAAEVGIDITPRQLFTYPTLRELAALADTAGAATATAPTATAPGARPAAGPDDPTPPVPLTPVQQWFFEQDLTDPHHWNQALALRVDRGLEPGLLRRALEAVAAHHPAFRLRFTRTDHGWEQREDPAGEALRVVEQATPRDGWHRAEDVAALSARVQTGLDITAGPVFAAGIAPGGEGDGPLLLLAAHHLVVDFVSWQIVVDDLARACRQLQAGEEVRLRPDGTAFADWSRRLREHAASPGVRAELDHWTADADPARAGLPEDGDRRTRRGTQRETRTVTARLPEADTAALLARAGREAGPQDVVLAALADALAVWSGEKQVCVDVEGHGRGGLFDDVDLTRTVGWFTVVHPLRYVHDPGRRPAEVLDTVLDTLRSAPDGGVGHGLLRYACPDPAVRERMAALPDAPVSFNYLGGGARILDGAGRALDGEGLFTPLPLAAAGDRGRDNARPYSLEVSALVSSGKLQLNVAYDANEHDGGRVEDLAHRVLDSVRDVLADSGDGGSDAALALVREAWTTVLGHEDFGDDEDFFAVTGGHSLLVARIMAHIGQRLGRRFSLRLFFDNSTVAELARALATHRDAAPAPASAAVKEAP